MPDASAALARLAADRAVVLTQLDAMTADQLAFRPARAAWSPADVACHLARSETGLAEIVRRAVATGTALPGRPSGLRARVLDRLMRSDVRVAMPPAFAPQIAPTGAPFAESRAALADAQVAWREIAESLPPAMALSGVFRHPVSGPLTFAGTLGFAAAHLDHHRRQVERIRASAGFPG